MVYSYLHSMLSWLPVMMKHYGTYDGKMIWVCENQVSFKWKYWMILHATWIQIQIQLKIIGLNWIQPNYENVYTWICFFISIYKNWWKYEVVKLEISHGIVKLTILLDLILIHLN